MEILNKKNLIAFAIILIVAFLGYIHFSPAVKSVNTLQLTIGGKNIEAELAVTKQEKEQGLSGRKSLKENTGMLFIFDKPGKYFFWMKDMNFPIDMIWLTNDMKVVYIKKDARPESYPDIFGPDEDAKYVLEVVAGFSEENNLKIGDNALFTY